MKEYIKLGNDFLNKANADALAVSIIDFKSGKYEFFELHEGKIEKEKAKIYFDLASLTKPLTNSFYAITHKVTDDKFQKLLNHRAGLPAWGLLGKSWKEQILKYPIKDADTLYSDFSAIRFMLEMGDDFEEEVFKNLDPDIYFWKDLPKDKKTVQNGFVKGRPNYRCVHDPNAFNLSCFLSHAGLFGSVEALSKTLLMFQKSTNFIETVSSDISGKGRFVWGFDTVKDPSNTLAGKGCGVNTFGHLGFTGTSVWIDPDQMKGHVILSNSTKYFWFDKVLLNQLRRAIGEQVWQG